MKFPYTTRKFKEKVHCIFQLGNHALCWDLGVIKKKKKKRLGEGCKCMMTKTINILIYINKKSTQREIFSRVRAS